jgi:tetratricopeptide (TPR) repeat protein
MACAERIELLRTSGRGDEALALVDEMKHLSQAAGLGPWTRLADESYRLHTLVAIGRHREALSEVTELLARMDRLPPESPAETETIAPWTVRETTLGISRTAALGMRDWRQALDLNNEILASKQRRRVPLLDQAHTRFNNYVPLLHLGRVREARELLSACRAVAQRERDHRFFGLIFSALASLDASGGRFATAAELEKTALRSHYRARSARPAAASHFNLAIYLGKSRGDPRDEALAHRLAATLLAVLTGESTAERIAALIAYLERPESAQLRPALPRDVAVLAAAVETTDGVRFRELVEELAGDRATADTLLRTVVERALDRLGTPE